MRQRTTADEAMDLAGRTFARRPLPVECEADELNDVGPELPEACDRPGTWLALYSTDSRSGWQTTFLCRACKKKLQRTLKMGPDDACAKVVFVKDWRTQDGCAADKA